MTIDESRLVGSYASGDSPPIALDLLPGGVFVERIDGRQVKGYWQIWTLEGGNWSDSRDRYSIELAGLVLSVDEPQTNTRLRARLRTNPSGLALLLDGARQRRLSRQ